MRLPAVVPDEAASVPQGGYPLGGYSLGGNPIAPAAGVVYPAGSGYSLGQAGPAAMMAPRYPIGPPVFSAGYDAGDPFTRAGMGLPPQEQPLPVYANVPPGAVMADIEAQLGTAHLTADQQEIRWRTLPDGVLWKPYLASPKESRIAAQLISVPNQSSYLDGVVGGRFALWRYGNGDAFFPEGVEWDVEGAAQVRLDLPNQVDLHSVDFRVGTFLTWGDRWHQAKFGYYHLSSHLGDEFLLKNPTYPRLNYARDCLLLGQSFYLTEDFRVYGEVDWAFWSDVAQEWEFQFGAEWAPSRPTGPRGAPFAAIHGQLREELNYGGNVTVQAGWAWVGDNSRNMFRMGFHYVNGASTQESFYNKFEQQIGAGIWFDR